MKVLVTGSMGLVGTNLVRELEKQGHRVYGVDLINSLDLRDKEAVEGVFQTTKPEVVYHLAANAAEARGQISPIDITENNLMIFVNTLRSAINVKAKKFLFTSSVAVYGEAVVPYKEDGLTLPKDVYGVNKLAGEQILKIMSKVYGFDYTIFRPHNIYGPHQSMVDPYKNVVALFMRKIMEKQPYVLFDEGKMRRAFSYVDDVVGVMVEALDDSFNGITMNVGSSKDITIKELSDTIQSVTGVNSEIESLPARPQEISMFLADHSTQERLTNYKETPLKEGLKKTWEWVKKNPLLPIIRKEDEIYV